MDAELFQWPITPATFELESLLAPATASLGSCWSSSTKSSIFFPSTPPFSFHSLTASSTPFFKSFPIFAWSPVMGPATPIFIVSSFLAQPVKRVNSEKWIINNKNANFNFFMLHASCSFLFSPENTPFTPSPPQPPPLTGGDKKNFSPPRGGVPLVFSSQINFCCLSAGDNGFQKYFFCILNAAHKRLQWSAAELPVRVDEVVMRFH